MQGFMVNMVADHISRMEIGHLFPELSEMYRKYALQYPLQRIGQIFCNYICPDYQLSDSGMISGFSQEVMENLFPVKWDPFYEKDEVTMTRWGMDYKGKTSNFG